MFASLLVTLVFLFFLIFLSWLFHLIEYDHLLALSNIWGTTGDGSGLMVCVMDYSASNRHPQRNRTITHGQGG